MNYYGQFNNRFPPPMYYEPDYNVHPDEKKKIRKNYNAIGAALLILYILINVICITLYAQFSSDITYNEEGMAVYGFADMLIGGCMPAVIAILVFFGYCLCTRYNPKKLFRVKGLDKGQIFRYCIIVLGLQQASRICAMFLSSFLYSHGLEVSGLNYVLEHEPSAYAADIFGAVILAPIGEELIYRGVVLRCASKVSQRFAIFLSAFIFGIMHGNPYQLVLGFLIGIPMAMITIKTGSLIPSIICHIVNNVIASMPSIIEYFNEDAAIAVNLITIPIFLLSGIVFLAFEVLSGRMKLPKYTKFHKKRTFPIIFTSWSMIIIMIIYVSDLILSVGPIQELPEAPEMITETARMIFLK